MIPNTKKVEQPISASKRAYNTPWSPIRNMMSLASKIPDVINLTVGQPNFDTPQHITKAAKEALDAGFTRYSPTLGIPELRKAIAKKLHNYNQISVDPETQIIVTVGAQEAIILSLLSIMNPGDEIILPDPAYTNYFGHAPLVEAKTVLVPVYEENGFMMRGEDILSALTPKSKVLLINTPANPTGAAATMKTVEEYARIAQEHNLIVVSDEAYESLVYDGVKHISIGSLPGMAERTISIFTFSKSYAMTGWRVGYLTGPENLISVMHKVQENIVSCPATFSQYGALAALEGPQDCVRSMVSEYDIRRRFLLKAFEAPTLIHCFTPTGAFYAFLNIKETGVKSVDLAMSLLEKYKVATVPGNAFGPGGEGYLRLCYGSTPLEILEKGIARICDGVFDISK